MRENIFPEQVLREPEKFVPQFDRKVVIDKIEAKKLFDEGIQIMHHLINYSDGDLEILSLPHKVKENVFPDVPTGELMHHVAYRVLAGSDILENEMRELVYDARDQFVFDRFIRPALHTASKEEIMRVFEEMGYYTFSK